MTERPESSSADTPNIFIRAGQFFLVPLGIVLVCVGVYLFFTYLVYEQGTPDDWIKEIHSGGAQARKQAVHRLVTEIRRQVADKRADARLIDPIHAAYNNVPPDETDVRLALLLCLGLLDDRRAVAPLVAELERSTNPETKAACIASLGALKAVEAGDVLIKLLDHESSIVRKYATFNLGAIAAPTKEGEGAAIPGALQHLQRKLNDPRAEVKWNAATALAVFLNDPAGKSVLQEMLDRKFVEGAVGGDKEGPSLVGHAMAQACHAVAALKDKTFADVLKKLSETDPDPQVRTAAKNAMKVL